MRFLILLFTIIAVGIWLYLSLRPKDGLPDKAQVPKVEKTPEEPLISESPLETELRDAVAAFSEARRDAVAGAGGVRSAIGALVEETERLETRVKADESFARRVHQPVKRLLLALYSVVQRAARATHRSPGEERDAVLTASVEALERAADQLGRITEQADEVAMRRLEADLEVLEERLQEQA